jgi:hypothetical protein
VTETTTRLYAGPLKTVAADVAPVGSIERSDDQVMIVGTRRGPAVVGLGPFVSEAVLPVECSIHNRNSEL